MRRPDNPEQHLVRSFLWTAWTLLVTETIRYRGVGPLSRMFLRHPLSTWVQVEGIVAPD